MQTRHQDRNLPTELLRALVTIAEVGSFTKAASRLNLSQPAVTTQMKRLETLVGGQLFAKAGGGVQLNERGKLVLGLARRMLDANDEILALTGMFGETRPIRVGVSNVYVDKFLAAYAKSDDARQIHVFCASSDEIASALHAGQVDVSCSFEPLSSDRTLVEWDQPLVWVRAATLVIRPNEPIPIVAWPGGALARIIIDRLDDAGLKYRIAFSSADYGARLAAVAAGFGVMAIPSGFEDPRIVRASARMLAELPPIRAGICVRKALPAIGIGKVVEALRAVAPQAGDDQSTRPSHADIRRAEVPSPPSQSTL